MMMFLVIAPAMVLDAIVLGSFVGFDISWLLAAFGVEGVLLKFRSN